MPQYLLRRCKRNLALVLPVILLLLSSCASQRYYNQRTMFRLSTKPGGQIDSSKLRIAVNRTEKNYRIQPNDFLQVRVYTNKGERILDPNGELQFGQPGGSGGGQGSSGTQQQSGAGQRGGAASQRNGGQAGGIQSSSDDFLVQADGTVVLPLLNRIRLTGLSRTQADSVLQVRYREYYKEPFVTTRVTNNRVFVLGAPGGLVIPLMNDNMSLIEVLALAGGIDGGGGGSSISGGGFYRYGGKANSIRIIRGDLKNPRVQQVDLTTLDGMRRANLQMEPNDIIYVEPVHRPVQEALVDAAPIISLASLVLTTTYFVIGLIKNNK